MRQKILLETSDIMRRQILQANDAKLKSLQVFNGHFYVVVMLCQTSVVLLQIHSQRIRSSKQIQYMYSFLTNLMIEFWTMPDVYIFLIKKINRNSDPRADGIYKRARHKYGFLQISSIIIKVFTRLCLLKFAIHLLPLSYIVLF